MLLRRISNVCIGWHQRHQSLFLQLLLLSVVLCGGHADPVSSPEIASKSNNGANAAVQQQQTALKASGQEQQLNSLSAYAAANGYDGLTEVNFKPSYKLPDMETNFTPMQSSVSVSGLSALPGPSPSPTPVLMQYFPAQSLNEGSVQYLQLIPTRPLIFPISPYLTSQQPTPYQQAALSVDNSINSIADYANRPAPVLGPLHTSNAVPPVAPHIVNVQSPHLPYGLHTYANAIQPYRTGFRINREIKDKNLPPGLTLNLHEYFPSSNEMPQHLFVRGRS